MSELLQYSEFCRVARCLRHKLRRGDRARFVTFADTAGATCITTEIAWPEQAAGKGAARPVGQSFGNGPPVCALLQRHRPEDRRTATDLLPHRYRRPSSPYIYRDDEITRLIDAAKRLPSTIGLRPQTYAALFGLYAVTGIRCNEPLRLDRGDTDLVNGVLDGS